MFRLDAKSLFGRQKAERLVHDPTDNPALAFQGGFMMPSWERRPMPDPAGAQVYAYEGIVLPPVALMGGGYEHGQLQLECRPMQALKTVTPTSYGPATGTVWNQPLYQPLPAGKS